MTKRADAAAVRSGPRPRRSAAARAFTLLEVLIAVGALGLIALGISQVFRATGETVKAGRRLSAMNTYAALIETQLREDFSRITRDGFLMIRNEEATGDFPDGILLYQNQPASQRRPRRVDEIVFFATGDFVTKRPPVHPSVPPVRAQAARVYIGHGLRWHPLSPNYTWPVVLHDDLGGVPPSPEASSFGYDHPNVNLRGANEFASDWVLMRHHTLLKRPDLADPPPLASPIPPWLPASAMDRRRDSDFQIGLQPAARSVFRSLSEAISNVPSAATFARPNYPIPPDSPIGEKIRFDCGAVDIAATDLTEIRAFLTAVTGVNTGIEYRVLPTDDPRTQIARAFGQTDNDLGNPTGWPTTYNTYQDRQGSIELIQEWMKNALPADSDSALNTEVGGRMRVEPKPPNPLAYGPRFGTDPLLREHLRADQMMLASSVFVPGCSEFIVEWSFGERYPSDYTDRLLRDELIWHGLERKFGRDGPVTDPNDPRLLTIARPYDPAAIGMDLYKQKYFKLDGTTGEFDVDADLIHDQITLDGNDPVAYSFFGYTNPTFNMGAGGNEPLTIPWPWPRLIRITMSLVDPADPTYEQTYQFVFELPRDPAEAKN